MRKRILHLDFVKRDYRIFTLCKFALLCRKALIVKIMARFHKYIDFRCVLDRNAHYGKSKLANQSSLYENSTSSGHVFMHI